MRYAEPRKYGYDSRYGKYRQIIEGNNHWIETFNKSEIPKSDNDIYHTVTIQQAYRPDIISRLYYNDPTLYWVILLANDMVDPFILDAGTIVRIPTFISLYSNNGVLNTYGEPNY